MLAEMQQMLDALDGLIRQVEARHAGNPSLHLGRMIEACEPEVRRLMDTLGQMLNDYLGTQPPPNIQAQVCAIVCERVRAWSSTSPLFYHIFNTPRQKLGPYEVFDLLLQKQSGGADVAGQIMDRYYMNTVAAASFRMRSQLLTERLKAESERRAVEHRPVRLLNLHTGSGHELQALARDRAVRSAIQVTCLDTDAAALRRVKQLLVPQLAECVSFRLGDARKIVQSRPWPDAPYDLIYALILFDQLSDRQVEPLIAGAYRGLRPGGKLIFGNYATSMPAHEHALIYWVVNLNLRRRSEEKLRNILKRANVAPNAISCELDPLGASWLVTAERV